MGQRNAGMVRTKNPPCTMRFGSLIKGIGHQTASGFTYIRAKSVKGDTLKRKAALSHQSKGPQAFARCGDRVQKLNAYEGTLPRKRNLRTHFAKRKLKSAVPK
jgi:hypothetical protein